jgi:hypothetical protein
MPRTSMRRQDVTPFWGAAGGRVRPPRNQGAPQGLVACRAALSEPQGSAYPSGWITLPLNTVRKGDVFSELGGQHEGDHVSKEPRQRSPPTRSRTFFASSSPQDHTVSLLGCLHTVLRGALPALPGDIGRIRTHVAFRDGFSSLSFRRRYTNCTGGREAYRET